jgi:ribosome maturation factor RimP
MSAIAERVRELVAPLVTGTDTTLYDVEYHGATLRVVLDRPGGIDMGTLTELTRAVAALLDESDTVPGPYTLEVSSPGLERALRTPEHFAGALGEPVRLKLRPGVDGDRRVAGELIAADEDTVTVRGDDGTERVVRFDDVTKANVHVDWSPPPKPGSAAARAARDRSRSPQSEATS